MLCVLCDLCCTPGIYSVEHPEHGHRSDRNMWVLRVKDIHSGTATQVCLLVCWFLHEWYINLNAQCAKNQVSFRASLAVKTFSRS